MRGRKNRRSHSINRRNFVGTGVKLVALGTLLMPVMEACNNKKSSKPTIPGTDSSTSKTTRTSSKKNRKKWSHESLVMNKKTNVLHYPTAKVYTYYDEIKPGHLQETNRAAWNPDSENAPKLNKQQSGMIMEILTLQELGKDISDNSLTKAIDNLSIAFRQEYEIANRTNFRLHELMLQLIALNSTIPAENKWQAFLSKVVKPEQLRKRQKWMETSLSFNERVNYILQRKNDYISRLSGRARKYSIS